MKISNLFLVLALLFSATLLMAAEPVRILSFNVRYGSANDGENSWPNRKEFLVDVIKEGDYDFIGGQEVLISGNPETNQLEYLKEKLSDYGVVVRSREKDANRGESMPIFYKKSRFELDPEQQGVFWLSDTPDEIATNTWNAACNRITTWGLFHVIGESGKRTGKKIYVFNTHFDHVSEAARQKSALLILERIHDRKEKTAPIVLMGDFNCGQKSTAIRFLKGETVTVEEKEYTPPLKLVDTFDLIHPDETLVVTFNSFKSEFNKRGQKIDYIFVLPETEVKESKIDRRSKDGRFPSDHFPVSAKVEL